MPTVEVECSECATVLPIEEEQLGAELKCPKCKSVFVAEKSGGAYEIADPAARLTSARPTRNPSAGRQPEFESRPETETERRLRERMEKWAEE